MTEHSRKGAKNPVGESREHEVRMAHPRGDDLNEELMGSSRKDVDIFHFEVWSPIDRGISHDRASLHA